VLAAVDDSAVRGADETSWQRTAQTHWLSVATAEQAALFQLSDRRDRDRDSAKALLGDHPDGVIVSDRYAVYLFIADGSASCASSTSCGTSSPSASVAALPDALAASSHTN
jgi:hypothetical protein